MRILDFFFALRPLVLVPAWSFFVLGHGLAGQEHFPALRFVLLSLVLVAVHLVNQIADAESDRINDKGYFLQRGIFSSRTYAVWATIFLAVALVTAVAGRAAPAVLAGSAALGLAYSLPPVRLCARPGADLAANAVGYGGLATLLGAGNLPSTEPWVERVAACMLAVATVFLHTTLLDLEGDRRTGKRTSGILLGTQNTPIVASGFAFAAMVAATVAASPILLAATICLAILTLAAWLAPRHVPSKTVCVGGTALFALAAGLYVPWFAALLALLVLGARTYYQRRFALAYPSLRRAAADKAVGSGRIASERPADLKPEA